MSKDEVYEAFYAAMKPYGLRKKKNLWFEVIPGGVRALYLEKLLWRNADNPAYQLLFCFYPAEYIDFPANTPPLYYKFPISDLVDFLPGVVRPELQALLDTEYDVADREEKIINLLEQKVKPVFVALKSMRAAKKLYEAGVLRAGAFTMPASVHIFPELRDLIDDPGAH